MNQPSNPPEYHSPPVEPAAVDSEPPLAPEGGDWRKRPRRRSGVVVTTTKTAEPPVAKSAAAQYRLDAIRRRIARGEIETPERIEEVVNRIWLLELQNGMH